jgi:hypothetical protein
MVLLFDDGKTGHELIADGWWDVEEVADSGQ